jgi:hypothetical protein
MWFVLCFYSAQVGTEISMWTKISIPTCPGYKNIRHNQPYRYLSTLSTSWLESPRSLRGVGARTLVEESNLQLWLCYQSLT